MQPEDQLIQDIDTNLVVSQQPELENQNEIINENEENQQQESDSDESEDNN